jgi:phosphocarrier protein HPr
MNTEPLPQTTSNPLPVPGKGSMRQLVTITNPQGLHLRPASAFAKVARQFESKITVRREDRAVNGKSQVELMLLAAEPGAEVILEVEGPDAFQALPLLAEILGQPSCDDDEDS